MSLVVTGTTVSPQHEVLCALCHCSTCHVANVILFIHISKQVKKYRVTSCQSPKQPRPIRMPEIVFCMKNLKSGSHGPQAKAHKPRHSSRTQDLWILHRSFMLKDGTCSLVSRDINCNQTGQTTTVIRMLKTDPNHCALYWSTHYPPVVRSKACDC